MTEDQNWDIIVNDGTKYSFDRPDAENLKLKRTGDEFRVHFENKTHKAELLELDMRAKQLTLLIDGKPYKVQIKDTFDKMVEKLGLNATKKHKAPEVVAPMPGMVLEILIKNGESVTEGQPVIILEAMKMENVLKAPGDGIVKVIKVKKGDPVDKKQVLIEME
jgi:biotin carboxyl carrier protein